MVAFGIVLLMGAAIVGTAAVMTLAQVGSEPELACKSDECRELVRLIEDETNEDNYCDVPVYDSSRRVRQDLIERTYQELWERFIFGEAPITDQQVVYEATKPLVELRKACDDEQRP